MLCNTTLTQQDGGMALLLVLREYMKTLFQIDVFIRRQPTKKWSQCGRAFKLAFLNSQTMAHIPILFTADDVIIWKLSSSSPKTKLTKPADLLPLNNVMMQNHSACDNRITSKPDSCIYSNGLFMLLCCFPGSYGCNLFRTEPEDESAGVGARGGVQFSPETQHEETHLNWHVDTHTHTHRSLSVGLSYANTHTHTSPNQTNLFCSVFNLFIWRAHTHTHHTHSHDVEKWAEGRLTYL